MDYLETPRLPLKFFVTSLLAELFEVLFHLLAKTCVQARQICKPRYTQIEMENMVSLFAEDLPKKGGLAYFQHAPTQKVIEHTFPTELAPNSTVNEGSPSKTCSRMRISARRGKKPG